MRRSRRKPSTLLSALILEIATLLAIVTVAKPTAVMHFLENAVHAPSGTEPSVSLSYPTPNQHIAGSNPSHVLDPTPAWPPSTGYARPVLPPQANLQFGPNYR